MFFLKDDSVLEMINEGLRGLWANLCEFIYPKITEMYSVFMDLSKLIYSDDLSAIYNKISLFLGIFMIFRLSFWLIEALMNPDILGDKAKAPGEMIKKVFLVVVLLGITPSLFKYAYKLQYEVVNSNVIGNIISDNKTVKPETKEFGKILSADLFSIFYRPNYDEAGNMLSAENLDCSIYTGTSDNNYEGYYYTILKNSGDLKYLSENRCLREKVEVELTDTKEKVDVFVVDFDGLYAVAVGIFVFWMILMYCISLGARYVQLIFLQVIAPIPIMGYLSTDKDNMFSKWVKQCTTTYLDVFIRIIIINFTVWLISMVLSGNSAIPSDLKKGGIITLFLVLGLLTFAKKAPELIQELLPKSVTKASGDFGLSFKKRTDAMLGGNLLNSAVKRAPGYVAGGVVGGLVGGAMGIAGGKGVGSRISGGFAGLARGLKTGTQKGSIIKNVGDVKKNQAARNNKLQQWRIAAGKEAGEANTFGDWVERKINAGKTAMGFETDGSHLKRIVDAAKTTSKTAKDEIDWEESKGLESNVMLGYARGRKSIIGLSDLKNNENRRKELSDTFDENKVVNTAEGSAQLLNWYKNERISERTKALIASGLDEKGAKQQATTEIEQEFSKPEYSQTSFTGSDLARTVAGKYKAKLDEEYNAAHSEYEEQKTEGAFNEFIEHLKENQIRSGNTLTRLNNFVSEYGDDLGIEDFGMLQLDKDRLVRSLETLKAKQLDVSFEEYEKALVDANSSDSETARKAQEILTRNHLEASEIDDYRYYIAALKSFKKSKQLGGYAEDKIELTGKYARATANDKFNSGSGK